MEVKLLSCQGISIKQLPKLPPDSFLYVFETTITGYFQAIEFIKGYKSKKRLFRLCIQYSTLALDAGPGHQEVKAVLLSYPSLHVFECKEILDLITEEETYTASYRYLLNKIILRNPDTGLSLLQDYFALNWKQGKDILIAMSVAQFKIPLGIVKRELELFEPPLYPHLPYALLSPSCPFSILDVKAGVEVFLRTHKHINWDDLTPHVPSVKFRSQGKLKWVSGSLQGDIDYLPFGKSHDEMRQDKARVQYLGTAWEPFKYRLLQPMRVEIAWNPVFLNDMRFETPNDYMKYWLACHLEVIRKLWRKKKHEQDRDKLAKEFLKLLYFQIKMPEDESRRYFIQDNIEGKKQRIMKDFNGDMALMDLEVYKLNMDYFESEMEVPDAPQDLWLQYLNETFI